MADIEVEMEKLRKATGCYHDEALKLLQLAEVAYERHLSADNDRRAEMLRCVGSNFSFDGVIIKPTYRKPFDVLDDLTQRENWRPQRDLNPCCRRERAVS